jgi:ATP-dependent Clp protease adaptor protein ClpS
MVRVPVLATDDPDPAPATPDGPPDAPAREAEPDGGGTATATRPAPARPRTRLLPQYRVLLHNDDVNDMIFVASTIVELARLPRVEAIDRMLEAHRDGLALLLTTHREHAELLEDQFQSKGLVVTIEPDV